MGLARNCISLLDGKSVNSDLASYQMLARVYSWENKFNYAVSMQGSEKY